MSPEPGTITALEDYITRSRREREERIQIVSTSHRVSEILSPILDGLLEQILVLEGETGTDASPLKLIGFVYELGKVDSGQDCVHPVLKYGDKFLTAAGERLSKLYLCKMLPTFSNLMISWGSGEICYTRKLVGVISRERGVRDFLLFSHSIDVSGSGENLGAVAGWISDEFLGASDNSAAIQLLKITYAGLLRAGNIKIDDLSLPSRGTEVHGDSKPTP